MAHRNRFRPFFAAVAAVVVAFAAASLSFAQSEPPDALVRRVSSDVLDAVKADPSIRAGDVNQVFALANAKVLPYFNFERMTASAVGPHWKDATAEQKAALQDGFKTLLVRVYSGALAQASDKTVSVKPMRGAATDKEVVVPTEIRGGQGEAIPLSFRLENGTAGWKIYDVSVAGVWLVDNYRNTFAQQINASGIDGLIARLKEKNQSNTR